MTRTGLSIALAILFLASVAPVRATWSIVAADTVTEEVAVVSATCVTNIDLKAFSPAVVVGRGAGAAQSFVDGSGQRRAIMRQGFLDGDSSSDILAQLEALAGTANHQHGLADTGGDAASGTGANNGGHASGVTGQVGSTFYAIQGNVLTGSPVVSMAEQAFVNTVGDLPEKVMAAMEAARAMGGDGRCSCSPGNPTGCGSPPANFTKSADVGFMIVARLGDTDDPACSSSGCADGDYFMDFNVANQGTSAPDPVLTLRTNFDAWRAGLVGRPDGVQCPVTFAPSGANILMTIDLRDWQGMPLGAPVNLVSVAHTADSDNATDIGVVMNPAGTGVYEVVLAPTSSFGTDRFVVTVEDGIRTVVIPPGLATLVRSPLFADGFESGDTAAWTVTVPSSRQL